VWDLYEEKWGRLQDDQVAVRKEFVRLTKASTEKPMLLDLGCGNGRDSAFFCGAGCSVVGLDISMEMLRVARTKCDALFVRADMRRLPVGRSVLDGVFCHSALYHVPRRQFREVLGNACGVLRHGGKLFLSVLEGTEDTVLVREEYRGVPLPVTLVTSEELTECIEGAGLRVIERRTYAYRSKEYVDVLCEK
jgi:ubiquinone/menaquinone biosynthesis C-methylase UbiE